MWCCILLAFSIPSLYNGNFTLSGVGSEFSKIQVNTPIGVFHVSRFPLDTHLLAYLDGYRRVTEITYVNDVVGVTSLRISDEVKSPLGLCIVLNKILRGKYLPAEVEGWYYIPDSGNKFGVSTDMLRIMESDELTAMCEYYRLNTLLDASELSEELLTSTIESDNSAIVLMHGYYPLLVYQKVGSHFYAYDPIRRTDKAFLEKDLSGAYIYRYGLLTYYGGEVVKCLDTLG